MIIRSEIPHSSLADIEISLRQAAERHGYSLVGTSLGAAPHVFEICDPALLAQLTLQNPEVAAVLPLRVCAYETPRGVHLAVLSPAYLAALWIDPGVVAGFQQMEQTVREILTAAGEPHVSRAGAARAATPDHEGATELQTSLQGQVPQRLDSKGTKVEELAGTGQHDSAGG